MKILELDNLSAARGGKIIFDKLSLAIEQGQNTAILGPNGAGKSTLLKLLTRELYPIFNSGKTPIRIFGESVWDVRELRSRLGIISNDFQSLFCPEMLGREVVASGIFNTVGLGANVKMTKAQNVLVDECMERLAVNYLRSREFATCSTGEQRRLLLARTLINKPEALILDEPTSGLDLKASILYVKTLRELMQEGNTTVILVTHNLNEIAPEMQQTILLKNGRVMRAGTTKQVLDSQTLSELFEVPLKLTRVNGFYRVVPAE